MISSGEWQKVIDVCDEECQRSGPGVRLEDRDVWCPYKQRASLGLDNVRRAKLRAELERDLSRLQSEKKELENLDSELRLGNELAEWLKKARDLTSLQREQTFEKFKGRWVAIAGEIADIGDSFGQLWGENTLYISIEVAKQGWYSSISVKFMISDGWRDRALGWNTGATMTFRGQISSRGDLFNEATIRDACPVAGEVRYRQREIEQQIINIREKLDGLQ